MKILILNSILFTAETDIPQVKTIKDTMIYGVCMGFVKLGHQVTLAAANEYRPIREEDYDFDVRFFSSDYTKLCKPSVLPYSKTMKRYLKECHKEFDMIISSEVFQFQSLYAAMMCPKKTLIWQELTTHQNKLYQIPSKIWYNIIARFFMRKIMAVIPRSRMAYDFVSHYMPRVSSIIVDHGIDIDKFVLFTKKKRQVISSSQLILRKNVDSIIHIFAKFHQMRNYEDIKLLIAGRGEEETNLKHLVDDLGLQNCIEFVGFLSQSKLNEYIRESLAFLVNTRKDLNMVSIPEAIISGTPILTNLKPASSDYIINYDLGIAKDHWNGMDIKLLLDKNEEYVGNCIKCREYFTNTHSAKLFLEIFGQK